MKKFHYVHFICGLCSLEFGIIRKDYDKKLCYTCPLCMFKSLVTPGDLKPEKRGRRKVPPTIIPRED